MYILIIVVVHYNPVCFLLQLSCLVRLLYSGVLLGICSAVVNIEIEATASSEVLADLSYMSKWVYFVHE